MTQLNEQRQEMLFQSMNNAAIQAEEFNLVALLKPSVTIDGNKWCVLYGDDIMTGIAGFGDSPYLAVLDFGKAWNARIPLEPTP